MKRLWFSLCLGLGLLPNLAYAQSQSSNFSPDGDHLIEDDLIAAFKNKTHEGTYNDSLLGFESDDYIETFFPDGRVLYEEKERVRNGIWYKEGNQLCFSYSTTPRSGGCFNVYKVGNCYYHYEDNVPNVPENLQGDHWTARTVVKGEMPQCEAAIS